MSGPLLDGKVAIVTGGGSGMGRAVALGFAKEGARVVLCGRREDEGGETERLIREAGGEGLFVRADVSQAADVEALVATAVERFGRLDVAFNNAGAFHGFGPLADLSEEDFERSMAANIRSMFLCLKYEIAQMMRQGGGGSIVNNASAQSHLALGLSAHYTAAKHAILGYTRAAAVDYARHGIRVNAISPGIVLTPMMAGFDPAAPQNATLMSRMPAGRVATPEEIVGTVVFMASDMSPYMHGAAISLDGGWTAH
ncbi:SDR family NAD(P)-dependent oxidoreductase [Sphingomonas profundi]|uniref:SDR family NAD(P)-dependent oxidoreductase n=1 Tax=Alterirhizorhabdus profundi TaxID=2681549 RepID=UPI0012E6FFFE|nr:glucose 1-dehydrogenase [Sphingomonas profundi]